MGVGFEPMHVADQVPLPVTTTPLIFVLGMVHVPLAIHIPPAVEKVPVKVAFAKATAPWKFADPVSDTCPLPDDGCCTVINPLFTVN